MTHSTIMKCLVQVLLAVMLPIIVSGLQCQRCNHVVWKGGKGPGKIMMSRWPLSCQTGHGPGIDTETCAAGGKHVCTFIAAEISMIYSISKNITSGNSTVRNTTTASVTGIAYVRGCMTEQVGCFKSLSDANRRHVASEVANLVDPSAVSYVEVVAKRGSSCACNTNRCVASHQQQAKTTPKTALAAVMRATTASSTTRLTTSASIAKTTTVTPATTTTTTIATTTTSVFYQIVVGQAQRISDVYRIAGEMEAPLDVILCLIVVVIVCFRMSCHRRRRRLYISVVRLTIQRQWYQQV